MKYALVSGANGGIGGAIVKQLLENGYEVFGCDIAPASAEVAGVHNLVVDITKRDSVEAAFAEVSAVTDKLDVIINAAGIMFMGSVIEEPAERFRKILDINVVGTYLMNEVFFPLIEKGRGRIINFSSEYGKYTTVPFNAFYTTSKHAIESYTDGLRRELKFLGIKVITIRPGAFKTNMEKGSADAFRQICEKTTHYQKTLSKLMPLLIDGTKNAKDPSVIAKVTLKAVLAKNPKRVYKSNHSFSVKFMSKLSMGMIDSIFYNMFK
jgi:NAD(P)-dependent dehydrogenase (short-subunit alcohol dehydrogenase family)